MNANAIDDWFVSLRKSNGKQLSSNTKNKILYCLRYIMQTAVTEGYISSDPTKDIESITENGTKNRDAFTLDELYILFPKDNAELVKAWGGLMWTTYFLVMRDTGWRPAEVSGLKKGDYHPDWKFLIQQPLMVIKGLESLFLSYDTCCIWKQHLRNTWTINSDLACRMRHTFKHRYG